MPDITMCEPVSCDIKETCYRFTATPSERQAYADFSKQAEDGKCQNFIMVFYAQSLCEPDMETPYKEAMEEYLNQYEQRAEIRAWFQKRQKECLWVRSHGYKLPCQCRKCTPKVTLRNGTITRIVQIEELRRDVYGARAPFVHSGSNPIWDDNGLSCGAYSKPEEDIVTIHCYVDGDIKEKQDDK